MIPKQFEPITRAAIVASLTNDVLVLPDVIFEAYESDVSSVMRPAFDAMWNACGFVRSFNYDENGDWAGERLKI